jgi:hypothetical protein
LDPDEPRGSPVTLFEGPAYAVGAVAGALAGGAVLLRRLRVWVPARSVPSMTVRRRLQQGPARASGCARRGEVTTVPSRSLGLGATGLLTAWILDRSRIRTVVRMKSRIRRR